MGFVHNILIFLARYLHGHMFHIIKMMEDNHGWAASIF